MQSKELITAMAKKMNATPAEAKQWHDVLVKTVQEQIKKVESVSIQGLGKFEVKPMKKRLSFRFIPHVAFEKCLNFAVAYLEMQAMKSFKDRYLG